MDEKRAKAKEKEPQAEPSGQSEMRKFIRNDVVGVSDWKQSKIGFLTGASSLRKSVGNVGTAWSDAYLRTSGLMRSLTSRENVPALEDGGEADERFEASMVLHNRTENDLEVIVRNTYRSSLLYAGMLAAGIAFGAWTMMAHPPQSIVSAVARFGPLPLVAAMLLKHLYTNWMVRRRRLDSLAKFFVSLNYMPSSTMKGA